MHVCVVSKFTCLVDFAFMLCFGSSTCAPPHVNMREGVMMMCVWGDLVRSICVVDVHDTNMGFKHPCHFVIVHMNTTFVVVVLVGTT